MFFQLICIGLIFHSVNNVVGVTTPESNGISEEYFTEIAKEDLEEDVKEDSKEVSKDAKPGLGSGPCTNVIDVAIDALEKVIECSGKQRCVPFEERQQVDGRELIDHPTFYRPMDCAEILELNPSLESGVYTVWLRKRFFDGRSIQVYCDMDDDGGGWTVIQRRGDFGAPAQYFWRNWTEYKRGFGDLAKDFWLGNDNIYALTNQNFNTLKFELEDWEAAEKFAEYDEFRIDDEFHKYTAHITEYRGTAGDSFRTANNIPFTTIDRDNDRWGRNCAEVYKGAWWYTGCGDANLNALYLKGHHKTLADGVIWHRFRGWHYSLKYTTMKIRPKVFRRPDLPDK